jgi:hypothetical protein
MNKLADAPAPPTSTWAHDRLRLGQANVGFWVLAAVAVIAVQPAPIAGGWVAQFLVWTGIVAAFTALQLPFDVLGGWTLPVRHGRTEDPFDTWFGRWARGAILHATALVTVGGLLLATASAGLGAVVALTFVTMLLLLVAQPLLLSLSTGGGPTTLDPDQQAVAAEAGLAPAEVRIVDARDRSFRAGWVGLPGMETLLVPARWADDDDTLAVQLTRRAVARQSGARTRGLLAALAFNLVGWLVVLTTAPGASLATASGLAVASAGYTLWAFLGILTLPRLSRAAVMAADRLAASRLGTDRVAAAVRVLDTDQEDEDDAERTVWIGQIFHPVPTPSRRIAQLEAAGDDVTFYRVTRTSLFLGWAQLSMLSRAVHCNIGRSDLWVLLPGD